MRSWCARWLACTPRLQNERQTNKSVAYSNQTSNLTCNLSDAGCHILVDDTLDCQDGNRDSPAITSARLRRVLAPSVSSSNPEEKIKRVNSNGAQERNSACENTHRLFSFYLCPSVSSAPSLDCCCSQSDQKRAPLSAAPQALHIYI